MNKYIIDPQFFYWIEVADNSWYFFVIAGMIALIIGGSITIINLIKVNEYDGNDDDKKKAKKLLIIPIIGLMMVIGSIFIPSKDTLIKMQIAKFGTYENAEKVIKVIDEKTDDLIKAIGKKNE